MNISCTSHNQIFRTCFCPWCWSVGGVVCMTVFTSIGFGGLVTFSKNSTWFDLLWVKNWKTAGKVQSEAALVHASSRISYGGNVTLWVLHPYGFPPAVWYGGGVPRFSRAPQLCMETPRKWSFEKSAVWIVYMNEPLAWFMFSAWAKVKNWTLGAKEQR